MNEPLATHERLIYSSLAEDPDLCHLVDLFIEEMPEKIQAIESQTENRDWPALTRTAHQLKGAAGSYGFDDVTPYAARLEAATRENRSEEEILQAAAELLQLCHNIRPGVPENR